MMMKILSFGLFVGIVWQCITIILPVREKLTPTYWDRYETLKAVFENSQYGRKDYQFWIPDETVYAYAGGAYLRGANPILVESTQPPLGKYGVGLSIALFQNENVGILLSGMLLLIVIGYIAYSCMGSIFWSLLTVFLFLTEPLFRSQFTYMPLLDTGFILLAYLGLALGAKGIQKNNGLLIILSCVLVTCASQTKVWVSSLPFFLSIIGGIFFFRRNLVRSFIIGLIISIPIIIFSYYRTITGGFGILTPLKAQKYLLWYHTSKINGLGTIWPLVYLNRWYVWWGDAPIIKDQNWSVSWLLVISGAFATLVTNIRKRLKKELIVSMYMIFFVVECVFLSLGQANARYLYPILPISYILSLYGIKEIGMKIWKKRYE